MILETFVEIFYSKNHNNLNNHNNPVYKIMAFPLYIFLIIYLVFLLGWIIFSLVAIYHMLKFGFLNFTTFFIIFVYIVVAGLLLAVSYNFLNKIDWNSQVSIFDNLFDTRSDFFDF